MEIIKRHKKCNKKDRKVLQPKALSKSDKPIDDPSEEELKPKRADGKKTTAKAVKKVKKTPQPQKRRSPRSLLIQTKMTQTMNKNLSQNSFKKHQKHLSLLIQTRVMNKNLQ